MGGAISGIVAGDELYLPLHPLHRPNRPALRGARDDAVPQRGGHVARLPRRHRRSACVTLAGQGAARRRACLCRRAPQHAAAGAAFLRLFRPARGLPRDMRLLHRGGARLSPVLRGDPPARLRRAGYAAADPDRGAALMFRSFGFDEFVLLLDGARWTLPLTALAFAGGGVLGLVLLVLRIPPL